MPQLDEIGNGAPAISIVTPAYNCVDTIEETICSVANQRVSHFEHIIIDGGSTDGTVEILKRYPHLTWISERDNGQADALNKGFRLASGELIGWLNADDIYAPGALPRVTDLFARSADVAMIHGDMTWIDAKGSFVRQVSGRELKMPDALLSNPVNQQSAFVRRSVFDQVGYLRTDLHYAMDYEFWLRIGDKRATCYVPETWASFRMMPGTKTVSHPERFWLEILRVYDEISADPSRSYIIEPIKRLAYGRMHWLAATGLCRAGNPAAAKPHARTSLKQCGLLGLDYEGVVSGCRFIEAHEFDPPVDENWIDQLLQIVPRPLLCDRRFVKDVRSFFYATRADYRAYGNDVGGVRQDTVRALRYNPSRWVQNHGFLRQGLAAWVGPSVASWIDGVRRRSVAGSVKQPTV